MVMKKKTVKKPGASRGAAKKSAAVKSLFLGLPRIGAPWVAQGGTFVGIVRGEKGQLDYALVVPTKKNATLKDAYGPSKRVTGAENEYDGMANTKAMAAAGSGIAKQALALRIAGHADFYIPSKREARLAQTNAPELFKPGYHWTSTQSRADSACAWVQHFGDGDQLTCHEGDEFPVRAVRRIPIQ